MRHSAGTRLFPVVVMASLAALTFWLDRATQPEEARRGSVGRHDPDYIVDQFEVKRFDVAGALQHTLVAQKMLHYPDDESTEVIAPRLTYHRTPPTQVFADKAWLDKDGKHVRLEGNVNVVKTGVDGRPPTKFITSVLYAVPDDEFAHTDVPVTISEGQSVITGTAFETSGKTNVSVLYGRVEGVIHARRTESAAGKPAGGAR
jgi:lipopolysaccharide export system protein LptC